MATMNGSAPNGTASVASARRTELAAFLRARRERIQPEDVGLPPGTRRRTAGLRREELAQLAGVGVTWYTWLEQGRKINASVQVLDAIATTLRLDATERAHLFRLADVPGATAARPTASTARCRPRSSRSSTRSRSRPSSSPSGSTCSPGTRCTRRSSPASPRPRPASATRCSPTSRPRPAAARWRIPIRTATCWSRSCGRPTAGTSATPPGRTSSAAWRRSARRSPPPGRPTTCPRRPAYTKQLPPPGRRPHHHHHDQLRGQRRPRRPPGGLHPRRRAEQEGHRPAGRGRPAGRPLPLLVQAPSRTDRADSGCAQARRPHAPVSRCSAARPPRR